MRGLSEVVLGAWMLGACGLGGCIDPASSQAGDAVVADAMLVDAVVPDAELPDAELPDAELPDAELPDAVVPDAELPDAELPDAELPDAELLIDATVDAAPLIDAAPPLDPVGWDAVQPILNTHCGECHGPDNGGLPVFVDAYALMGADSQLCPGATVGECIVRAVQNEEMEGARCRTYVVEPFHRAGWPCLNAGQIDLIEAWGAAGRLE